MITAQYCRTMAQYNAWQNKGLRENVARLDHAELSRDRGAFFGSILGTLSHLLWGDQLWMSRFDGGAAPEGGIAQSPTLWADATVWSTDRFKTDGRISEWARHLNDVDLVGDLTWFSGAMNKTVTKPLAFCVAHFFNHQTHHRGQVHALLTAAGQKPQDTDLFFMPTE